MYGGAEELLCERKGVWRKEEEEEEGVERQEAVRGARR